MAVSAWLPQMEEAHPTMSKKKSKKPYTGRDYNMVSIIKGANKAYVEKDQKKEASKKASRSKVDPMDIEYIEPLLKFCSQCGFPINLKSAKGEDEEEAMLNGFCSLSCMDYYTEQGV